VWETNAAIKIEQPRAESSELFMNSIHSRHRWVPLIQYVKVLVLELGGEGLVCVVS